MLPGIDISCWHLFFVLLHSVRYDSPQHIMEEFFTLRMEFYHRRKASLMSKMQGEWSKLDNKVGQLLFGTRFSQRAKSSCPVPLQLCLHPSQFRCLLCRPTSISTILEESMDHR